MDVHVEGIITFNKKFSETNVSNIFLTFVKCFNNLNIMNDHQLKEYTRQENIFSPFSVFVTLRVFISISK